MKNKEADQPRRDFIKKSALAVGAMSVIPGHYAFSKNGALAPSEKVNIAFCGIGNRGRQIFNEFMKTKMINIVAFCDTDMGAPHTLQVLEEHPDVPRFQDFRKMFDEMGNKIEAVCIGVPDFSHFPIAILAMSMGKHVYVEKPLTRTFREAELLMAAEKKYKVVTQMGNQGHSDGNCFQFKAWVDAGIISDVENITAHMNNSRRWHKFDPNMKMFPSTEEIPSTLDWDTWLMASEYHKYHEDFINGQWRCWYDHGMGALGDWGAHIIDTAHQFLDLGLPTEINPTYLKGHNHLFYPLSTTLEFKFPKRKKMPACTITWYDGLDNQPPLPEGYGESKLADDIPAAGTGKIEKKKLNPGKIIYGKDLTFKGGSHGSTLEIIPTEAAKDMEGKLPEVPKSPSNHFLNFLRACKGKEETRSPFSISGPLSQVFVLGTIAQRLGIKLEFDRETKTITNDKYANGLLDAPPPRKGWEEFYKL